MSEEIKYCKFCGQEKHIKDFCKSGFAVKNICRECQNKKQKEIYHNSKKVKDLQQRIDELQKQLEEQVKYNLMLVSDDKGRDYYKNIIDKAIEILEKTDYEYSSRTELFNIILEVTETLGGKK